MELPSGGYLSRDAVAARPELMLTPGHPFCHAVACGDDRHCATKMRLHR